MEYEIDDEQVLFDESTNPSLKRKRQEGHLQPPAPPARRKPQSGVAIPEEEEELA